MRFLPSLLLPFALVSGLSACAKPEAAAASDGWVRLAAAPGRPAAGYFTLKGGPSDATLTAVASPAIGRIELHESMRMDAGGMAHMTMRPLGSVAVPAGQAVRFEPGGKHLMLFDIAPSVKPGGRLPLTFRFADGTTLTNEAQVVAAGDAAPSF